MTCSSLQVTTLESPWQEVSEQPSHIIRHRGKADRLAALKPVAAPTKTVSLRQNDLADISLLRIPSALARTAKPPMLLRDQSPESRLTREPMVSTLTEVEKRLKPGRCVT